MTTATENATILTTKLLIKPECMADFADWQAKLNAAIAASPGFASLEILSPIYLLGWWLVPKPEKQLQATLVGTLLIIVLYLIEIAIFWNFL